MGRKSSRRRRGKHQKRNRKEAKAAPGQAPSRLMRVLAWGWARKAWSVVLGAVSLVGLLALQPQVTVTPGEQLDHGKAFSVPFYVTNNGLLPLKDVTMTTFVPRLELDDAIATNTTWFPPGNAAATLDRQETKTMMARVTDLPGRPVEADVVLVLDFRSAYWPFPLRRFYRFVMAGTDGWRWVPQPTDEALRTLAAGRVDKLLSGR